MCQTPRTTEFLRQQYDYWESQSTYVGLSGIEFYMKPLEKQGFLTFNKQKGTWRVTQKGLDYIAKYHGK